MNEIQTAHSSVYKSRIMFVYPVSMQGVWIHAVCSDARGVAISTSMEYSIQDVLLPLSVLYFTLLCTENVPAWVIGSLSNRVEYRIAKTKALVSIGIQGIVQATFLSLGPVSRA